MALTTIENNNKLIKFTQEINREFCRENTFSAWMGEELTSVIRIRNELKSGGDTINLPIVTRLRNAPVGSGTLVGVEEKIDNYGQRVKVDWARNAVTTNAAEQQKDSADIFGEAKPLLSDWGKELQRDEIIAASMALPSETLPGTDVRVNGILYQNAVAGDFAAWRAANPDRIVYGASASAANFSTTHVLGLAQVDTTADKLTPALVSLLKRQAMNAQPKIRPIKTKMGYEYYVLFVGTNPFRDLKDNMNASTGGTGVDIYARPRETTGDYGAPPNPLFQDGDRLYDGVIIRQIPEISNFVGSTANPGPWATGVGQLLTAGAGPSRVEPVFLCGQQAVAFCWGSMAKPTFRREDDYQFITGTGIQMCYGVSKVFKKHPMTAPTNTSLVQFGMVTGFVSAATD
jgi:Protein of unknown function (DUF4043)